MIKLYIESATGKIVDVVLKFTTGKLATTYTQVPVSVYREIEVELKKSVRFTPSAIGKNLSYIFMFWKQDPNVTIQNAPLKPLEPVEPDLPDNESPRDDGGPIVVE